jgi:DNA-binding beta-propeller fold protein YncE
MPIIGTAPYRYEFQRNWARLPRGWTFGETASTGWNRTCVSGAVAPNGDVMVLCRGAHPVLVFDAEGNFQTSWGEGVFSHFVHGLSIDRSGDVWITDTGLHTVTRHAADGAVLQTMGHRHHPASTFHGRPFNMPTGTAFTSDGDIYVSDGYGNRRVHRFAPDGTLRQSWGEPGNGPGQFALVHFIAADPQDRLYVCDRENHRIQVFAPTGEFLSAWTGFTMPSDVAFGRDRIYVGGGDGVSVWTLDHRRLAHFTANEPFEGAFKVHGIWLDAEENIYLAQFDRTVSKLTRVSG